MSQKIGILDYHQKTTDTPRRHVKRSAAKSLKRRGLAEWVVYNEILQMLPIRKAKVHLSCRMPSKPYIPEKLPYAEIPQTIFKLASDPLIVRKELTLARRAKLFCDTGIIHDIISV